jgi:exonuclease SbcC
VRLIRLKLENFRQHQDTEIEFSDGMTAIVGANGTGKTTLLEAITFALYGKQRETKDTVRFYWADRNKFSSTLTFEFDGAEYEVHRATNDATFSRHVDGLLTVLATGQVEVTQACERLLGLNYKHFKNSFCAEQRELQFLNFENTAKQEQVAQMLGFDRLKSAEEIARSRFREFKATVEVFERTLQDPQQLKKARDAAAQELKQTQKEAEATKKKLADSEAKLPAAREQKAAAELWRKFDAELSEIRGMAEGLKQNEKTTAQALQDVEKDVAELAQIEPKAKEYGRLLQEAKEWERKRELDREREKLTSEAQVLKEEIAALDREAQAHPQVNLPEIDKKLQSLKEKLDRAQTEVKAQESAWISDQSSKKSALAAATAHHSNAEKALKLAQDMLAKGACPECHQPLGASYKSGLEKLQRELEDTAKELNGCQVALAKIAERPETLSNAEKEQAKLLLDEQKLRAERQVAADHAATAKALSEGKLKKCERLAVIEAKLAQTPALFELEKYVKLQTSLTELEETHRRFLALEDCRKKLPLRKAEHEKAQAELEAAKAKFRTLEQERAKLTIKSADEAAAAIQKHQTIEYEIGMLQMELKNAVRAEASQMKDLTRAEENIQEYEKRAKELEAAKSSALLHDTAARELRALREALNRSIGPDLSARASENLNLLTNGRYTQLDLDKNFEPTVVEEGVRKDVISGGEEDVVALALRLALSELIQERNGRPMSLLVLDEVFGGLDYERRHSVMERLAALKGRFRQILVISHIEEINQVADQAIFLRRNPDTRATAVSDAPMESAAVLL